MIQVFKGFLRSLRKKFYSLGSRKLCIICGHSFIGFISAGSKSDVFNKYKVSGAGFRKDVICSNCGSLDRSRLIYLFLNRLKKTVFTSKIKLLHVAPDTEFPELLKGNKSMDYMSIDSIAGAADLQMDINNLSLPSESFDVVICNHVIEQISDDKKALKELFRVLKKDGFAILQSPISLILSETLEDPLVNTPEQRKACYGQEDMFRIYGQDYKNRLSNAGFRVEIYNPESFLSPEEIDRFGVNPNENIFVGNQ